MTETAKKKRGMPSSFTILLALLAIVAVITVIVSGTSGGAVTAARLSDFCTAPAQTLKAIHEAEAYDGPSLIIGYSPCEMHSIKKGCLLAQPVQVADLMV